jgi:hypothetical protein
VFVVVVHITRDDDDADEKSRENWDLRIITRTIAFPSFAHVIYGPFDKKKVFTTWGLF